MGGVRAGAWGGTDGGREVQVDAHCRCLSHDVSDLALEAVVCIVHRIRNRTKSPRLRLIGFLGGLTSNKHTHG